MSLEFQPAIQIIGAHLTSPVVLFMKHIDNQRFVPLKKSDRRWERLLIVDKENCDASRGLPKTSICETIEELARAEFWRQLKPDEPAVGNTSARAMSNTLSKQSKAIQAQAIMLLDKPAIIEIPPIGRIEAHTMHILLPNPQWSSTIYIEVNQQNISYLQRVVAEQLKQGDENRKRSRPEESFPNEGVKGISFDYTRKQIRAMRKNSDGKVQNKYFKFEGMDTDEALSKAKEFVRGDDACIDSNQ